jgi:hypothetical protein
MQRYFIIALYKLQYIGSKILLYIREDFNETKQTMKPNKQ